ncbi:MAG: hypothetical protein ACI8X5_002805 [Planctomycetota bacterium]|jgi:hypothetical protein
MDRSRTSAESPAGEAEITSDTGFWTGGLVLGGLFACAAGTVLAVGPHYSPDLSWIARNFREMGIFSGALIGGGTMCAILAGMSHKLRNIGKQMRSAEEALECTQTLALGMRHMVDRMTRMQAEVTEVREGIKGILRVAQEQNNVKVAGMQVDATFHLAASMDQMSMRLEDRMRAQESTFESRLNDLLGSVAAEHARKEDFLSYQDNFNGGEDILDAPKVEFGPDLNEEPQLPLEELDYEEMEIFVELDEDSDIDDEEEVCDVTQFDWNDIELPSDGLGLLDELDEDGSMFDEEMSVENDKKLDRAPSLLPSGSIEAEEELFTEDDLNQAWKVFKRQRKD